MKLTGAVESPVYDLVSTTSNMPDYYLAYSHYFWTQSERLDISLTTFPAHSYSSSTRNIVYPYLLLRRIGHLH